MGGSAGLILFDCDGVLVDSEPIACAAVAEALQARGLAISAQEVAQRYIGISAAAMYHDIESHYGHAIAEAERRAIDEAVDHRLATTVEAMPQVAQAIEALSRRFTVCVASGGTPRRIAGSLARAGLGAYFTGRVFSATQVARGKPAPDLFLFAAATLGFSPAQCLVVEDSVAGVTAAHAAGMRCLGFLGGGHIGSGHSQRLLAAGALRTLQAMDELVACVDQAF